MSWSGKAWGKGAGLMALAMGMLIALAGVKAHAVEPPPAAGDEQADAAWVAGYEQQTNGPLADQGAAVLSAYRAKLAELDTSSLSEKELAVLRGNLLNWAEQQVLARLDTERRATNPQVEPFVIVPVQGTIGYVNSKQDYRDAIYAESMQRLLRAASESGVKHVVFHIKSDGGELGEAFKIHEVLSKHDKQFTYHAYIEKAYSASILLVFYCDHIYVRPDASVGGAVAYQRDSSGNVDVDAKVNSIWESKVRAAAQKRGHPGLLPKAMIVRSATAAGWLNEAGEAQFGALVPEPRPADVVFEDDAETVLTLTAKDMTKLGLAEPAKDRPDRNLVNHIPEDHRLRRVHLNAKEMITRWAIKAGKEKDAAMQAKIEREELMKNLEKGIPSALRILRTRMEAAYRADPRNYSYTYDADDGDFTSESMRKWRERTDEAVDKWRDVQSGCKQLADVMEQAKRQDIDVPITQAEVEEFYRQASEQIDRLRDERNNPEVGGF